MKKLLFLLLFIHLFSFGQKDDFEEISYFFTYEAEFIENPKKSYEFENNGLIKFFRFKDQSAAILDLNKSIELNPNPKDGTIFFIRGLIKKSLNIKSFCNDWKKSADLEHSNAKKNFRDNCNTKSL